MNIAVSGFNEAQALMKRFPKEAPKLFGDTAMRSANHLRDAMKAHPEYPVDTGRMRNATQSRRISLLAAGVPISVDYAVHVILGTKKMEARDMYQKALRSGAQKQIDDFFAETMNSIPH